MSISLESSSCSELLALCGRAISVQLISKEKMIGNLYTVDPETHSVVIVQSSNGQPENMVLIPGESILKVEILNEEESLQCIRTTPEFSNQLKNMFRTKQEGSQTAEETLEERKQKLHDFLKKKNFPFNMDGETFVVGAVKILPPYTKESCLSQNTIALGRITKVLDEALK